jgi:nitroreductase/NAD-dependent dihydropyrimidine dehydrogenase PreA subunit
MSFITIDRKLCKKDNLCIKECPANILVLGPDGYPVVREEAVENCLQCGHCQSVCPCDALTLRDVQPQDRPKVLKEPVSWETIAGLIESRRSVRRYKKTPVAPELLDKLLDVTRWAPTGGNSQLVRWLLVEKPETMKKLAGLTADWARANENLKFLAEAWDAGHDMILRGAPHLAIAYAGNEYGSTAADCVIAATTLDLAAASQGLGACWAGFFMMACAAGYKPLLEFLALPAGNRVHAALMLGYPKYGFARIPTRKPARVKRI